MKKHVVVLCSLVFLLGSVSPVAWAINPNDLSGLHLWFKTDSLSLNDNDPVNMWPDNSGNGWDMAVFKGGPTYQTSSTLLNGFPAVRFTTADGLQTPLAAGAALSGDPAFSLFLVANLKNGPAPFEHPVNWSGGGIAGGKGSAVEIDGQDLNWSTGFGADASTPTGSYAAHFDKPTIISFRRDAPGPVNNMMMELDGVPLTVGGHAGNPDILQTAVRLNADTPASSFSSMNMDVSELIIFARKLTDAEENSVGLYLSQKFQLNTSYAIPETSTFALLCLGASTLSAWLPWRKRRS